MSYAIRRDMHIHVYVFNRDILYSIKLCSAFANALPRLVLQLYHTLYSSQRSDPSLQVANPFAYGTWAEVNMDSY